jgi:hypothetical protein
LEIEEIEVVNFTVVSLEQGFYVLLKFSWGQCNSHVAEFIEISHENVRCNYKFIENTKEAPTEIILPILAK